MRQLSTREKVLVGVLCIGGLFGLRLLSSDGGLFVTHDESEQDSRSLGDPPVVRVDLLAQEPAAFDPKGRNLFAYYVPPRPKRVVAPPPPRVVVPRPKVERERPKPPAPPKAVAPKAPQPKFTYIGFVGPKDSRLAAFDDGGDSPLLARVGDLVTAQFRLASFEHNAVKLTYTDERWTGKSAELALTGKQ